MDVQKINGQKGIMPHSQFYQTPQYYKGSAYNTSQKKYLNKKKKAVGILSDDVDDTFGEETIMIPVGLPPILERALIREERVVVLLQSAVIRYNELLERDDKAGYGNAVVMGADGKRLEFKYVIKFLSFEPPLDWADAEFSAELSTKQSKKIEKLVGDGALSFYLSGKLNIRGKEIKSIVISKIISQFDQTAYAKKFTKLAEEKEKKEEEKKQDDDILVEKISLEKKPILKVSKDNFNKAIARRAWDRYNSRIVKK